MVGSVFPDSLEVPVAKYNAPKAHLHQEFLYLNHDTVLNALSAFEAGKVDEIIEKTAEAKDGGAGISVGAGPVKGGAGKKKQASIQEELVRTRTWFSAFDSWHRFLKDNDAIGTFDGWDSEVRNELSVGDTIEFQADVRLSPLHKLLTTFLSYAAGAGTANSPFQVAGKEAAEAKKTARMMEQWIMGREGRRNLAVYFLPFGTESPRIVARFDEKYIIGGLDNAEGRFTVIAQVDTLLQQGERESAIRIMREVPPTPKEIETVHEAMLNFVEPAKELGVELDETDLAIPYPAVIVRAIAVYK
jgi:hypothetical protein